MAYFGKEQEKAVRDYLNAETKWEKNKIYSEKLEKCFEKLVESIIGIYGKKYNIFDTGLDFHTLKIMGLSYLFHKINKFDPTRVNDKGQPIKAYSFFGTILRNYYLETKQKSDKEKRTKLNIHNADLVDFYPDELSYNEEFIPHEKIFLEKITEWYATHLDLLFVKDEEKKIAKAVIQILRDVDTIENFNKKFIYIQIREMTDIVSNHKITPVIQKMKKSYIHLRYNFENYGEILSGSLSI